MELEGRDGSPAGPIAKAGGVKRNATLTAISPIRAFNRETVATEVLRQLLNVLGSGDIRPGERLPSERQFAEAFGVGRSAVRDALKSLTMLGLVDVRQGDGMYLGRTDADVLPQMIEWGLILRQPRTLDLVEARRHIEIVVARLAADQITPATASELRHALDIMETGFKMQDEAGYIASDLAFHAKIAEIANNSVLIGVLSSARSLLDVWMRKVADAYGVRRESFLEHVKVCEAIESGDGDLAAAAMTDHMQSACVHLIASLAKDAGSAPTAE